MQKFIKISLLPVVAAISLWATTAAAADRLTLILDWFVNPDHGPIVVAQQRGYFAEAGLEVEVIAPADPSDPPKMVAAGKADLAVSYQPQLHLQVREGLPLRHAIEPRRRDPLRAVLGILDDEAEPAPRFEP